MFDPDSYDNDVPQTPSEYLPYTTSNEVLCDVLISELDVKHDNVSIISDDKYGTVKARRKRSIDRLTFSLTYTVLTKTEFDTLRTFYLKYKDSGMFYFRRPDTDTTHIVRFIDSVDFTIQPNGNATYTISCSLIEL